MKIRYTDHLLPSTLSFICRIVTFLCNFHGEQNNHEPATFPSSLNSTHLFSRESFPYTYTDSSSLIISFSSSPSLFTTIPPPSVPFAHVSFHSLVLLILFHCCQPITPDIKLQPASSNPVTNCRLGRTQQRDMCSRTNRRTDRTTSPRYETSPTIALDGTVVTSVTAVDSEQPHRHTYTPTYTHTYTHTHIHTHTHTNKHTMLRI